MSKHKQGKIDKYHLLSWEDHYRLSEHGVDNVSLTNVEEYENQWDRIVDACAG